jgi:hypothetical protein
MNFSPRISLVIINPDASPWEKGNYKEGNKLIIQAHRYAHY